MKQIPAELSAAALIFTLFTATGAASHAATPDDHGPSTDNHRRAVRYEGRVTNVSSDPTNPSFQITTRYGERTVTIRTTPSTRFTAVKDIGIKQLHTGDHIMAIGRQTSNLDGTPAIDAAMLVRPAIRPGHAEEDGISKMGAAGSVDSITPSAIVLKLSDGRSINANIGGGTPLYAPVNASMTSVVVGANVQVNGGPELTQGGAAAGIAPTVPDTIVATEIKVVPEGYRGSIGKHRRKEQLQSTAKPAAQVEQQRPAANALPVNCIGPRPASNTTNAPSVPNDQRGRRAQTLNVSPRSVLRPPGNSFLTC